MIRLLSGLRGGIRRRAVHDWRLAATEHGGGRDPAARVDHSARAHAWASLIVIAIYLGANAVYVHVLGRDGLAASAAVAADTAVRLVGPIGGTLITIGAMLSILGFVNVVLLGNSRIPFAMARDGAFLAAAGRIHPRYGTPHVAIGIMVVWSLVLLFGTRGDLGALLSGVVFADWIFFGLGGASVFVLRRTAS